MRIEQITLAAFQCFGPDPVSIDLSGDLTAFVGENGSGKTAVMQALQRMFGTTANQRHIRRSDFHVANDADALSSDAKLSIEVRLGFPELVREVNADESPADHSAVPEFFHQMAVAEEGGSLKCRLRLEATWTDDGTIEGSIDQEYWAITSLADNYEEKDQQRVSTADRSRIQMVYLPSNRDATSEVTSFLRGRIWRAIEWSENFRKEMDQATEDLHATFARELGVNAIMNSLLDKWNGLSAGNPTANPELLPLTRRFEDFIQRVQVSFKPGHEGHRIELQELGDGQRALFHIGMTLATLGLESKLRIGETQGFKGNTVQLPALTVLAVEEPENNLAPFYLSRIIDEVHTLTNKSEHVQALIASHSASLLGRVDPKDVRHFRLKQPTRTTLVNAIELPSGPEDETKFVRQAVQAYPELYFARFVVLGEGASEQIVIPRIAAALGIDIDQSFVAMVPLGGRHVNHFWHLLKSLDIPHVTLLDLDAGRAGGGWQRVKYVCRELLQSGTRLNGLSGEDSLKTFDGLPLDESIRDWIKLLRDSGVYFSEPLDLDMMMLRHYPDDYRIVPVDGTGPQEGTDREEQAKMAALGERHQPTSLYDSDSELFPWYRYLFLGRSKPDTHLRVLSQMEDDKIRRNAPEVLRALIKRVQNELSGVSREQG